MPVFRFHYANDRHRPFPPVATLPVVDAPTALMGLPELRWAIFLRLLDLIPPREVCVLGVDFPLLIQG